MCAPGMLLVGSSSPSSSCVTSLSCPWHASQVLAPVVLVDEVAAALLGPVASIKAALEARYTLSRGNTLLEHAQVVVTTAK